MTRIFDFTFALLGLIVLAPLMAAIALIVKLGDRGPVFFSHTRAGQFGRPFRMHKFRTMVPDAERKGLPITASNDRRITRAGHWLRRSKLDELPQLWNVLIGEMSLVGPRPEVPRYVDFYTSEQRRVLDVRPGITDPASLEFFDESIVLAGMQSPEVAYIKHIMPHKLAINLNYMRRRSMASDVIVVLATLSRMVTPRRLANAPPATCETKRRAA